MRHIATATEIDPQRLQCLGSLPYLAQRATTIRNIYHEHGNLNVVIADSATAQAVFFIIGLVAFALFAFSRSDATRPASPS